MQGPRETSTAIVLQPATPATKQQIEQGIARLKAFRKHPRRTRRTVNRDLAAASKSSCKWRTWQAVDSKGMAALHKLAFFLNADVTQVDFDHGREDERGQQRRRQLDREGNGDDGSKQRVQRTVCGRCVKGQGVSQTSHKTENSSAALLSRAKRDAQGTDACKPSGGERAQLLRAPKNNKSRILTIDHELEIVPGANDGKARQQRRTLRCCLQLFHVRCYLTRVRLHGK